MSDVRVVIGTGREYLILAGGYGRPLRHGAR